MNSLNHVAIIMDGNGRWGLKHKRSRNEGHKAGLNAVEKVIKASIKQKNISISLCMLFRQKIGKDPKKEITLFI